MNAIRWARLSFALVTALIVQVAVLDEISISGVHPDVMVLLAASAGLVAGAGRGAVGGFVVGCVADLVVNTPYGLSPLTFVLLGFGCGSLRFVSAERATTGTEYLTCIAAGVVGTAGFAIFGALVGQPGTFERSTLLALVVVALGAVVLAPLSLRTMRWVFSGTDARSNIAIPSGGSAAG